MYVNVIRFFFLPQILQPCLNVDNFGTTKVLYIIMQFSLLHIPGTRMFISCGASFKVHGVMNYSCSVNNSWILIGRNGRLSEMPEWAPLLGAWLSASSRFTMKYSKSRCKFRIDFLAKIISEMTAKSDIKTLISPQRRSYIQRVIHQIKA